MIDEAFGWLESLPGEVPGLRDTDLGLLLYRGNVVVLDQHDGIPAQLRLTSQDFGDLQARLEQSGLPSDLYYPIQAQQVVVEPTMMHGAPVLAPVAYSPRQWRRRATEPKEPLQIPSEEERLAAFLHACLEFVRALSRRSAELQQPGREPEPEQLAQVESLSRHVSGTWMQLARKSPQNE